MENDCKSTQLIDGDGVLNVTGLEEFIQSANLGVCGVSYAVVAIMGPQSSGKSTLLNNLFFTNFVEMNADTGRRQTTKGIWMAKAVDVEPFTVVLDIEGNDGKERGQDQVFEKQSALFALALADIVLINMWCHDIGRENGANKPLLRTVFQVMTQLFPPRKTTLLFVIRDKTRTPLEHLESDLRQDIEKIWEEIPKGEASSDLINIWAEVPKPEIRKDAALSDFFTVKVIGLGSYEEKEKQFKEQVAELRKQFHNSIAPGGLAGDRQGVVPWSGFSYSAQNIWEVIKDNKDLDLPSHKVMVATFRCEEIAREKLSHFKDDKNWLALEAEAKSGPVSYFGKQLSSILQTLLSEYDEEAMYLDRDVHDAKRQLLMSNLLQCVLPIYETLLGHLLSQATNKFVTQLGEALSKGKAFAASVRNCEESCMVEFDKQFAGAIVQQATDWDSSNVREKLKDHIKAQSSSLHINRLSEIQTHFEEKISDAINRAEIENILIAGKSSSWPSIRDLVKRETDTVAIEFLVSISCFEFDVSTSENMLQSLRDYATSVVVEKTRTSARVALFYMTDRFSSVFKNDKNSKPRCWNIGNDDITNITLDARTASLKILSALAATRLDEGPDNIEKILFSSLLEQSGDPLTSIIWNEVSPDHTIITPVQCKAIWKKFLADTQNAIDLAISIKIMAAPIRCDEIANEKLCHFSADERWLALKAAAQAGTVPGFGVKLSIQLNTYLSEYDKEAMLFDERSRDSKRQQLESNLLQLVRPTYDTLLGHLVSQATESFKTEIKKALSRGEVFAAFVRDCKESCMLEFDNRCADIQAYDWDASNAKGKLSRDIDAYSSTLPSNMLYAKALYIGHGSEPQYWAFVSEIIPNTEHTVEVAKLLNVCWLEVICRLDLRNLTVGREYEFFFDIELTTGAQGWNDIPVTFENNNPYLGPTTKFGRKLDNLIGQGRVEVSVGKLTLPHNFSGNSNVTFKMFEITAGWWKTGFTVRGVVIKPV